jgi:hypothetical protein
MYESFFQALFQDFECSTTLQKFKIKSISANMKKKQGFKVTTQVSPSD